MSPLLSKWLADGVDIVRCVEFIRDFALRLVASSKQALGQFWFFLVENACPNFHSEYLVGQPFMLDFLPRVFKFLMIWNVWVLQEYPYGGIDVNMSCYALHECSVEANLSSI